MMQFNFDDYGYSPDVSKVIIDCLLVHRGDSVSVMPDRVGRSDVELIKKLLPSNKIGVHIDLVEDENYISYSNSLFLSVLSFVQIYRSIVRQISGFKEQFGYCPEFIDFHQNSHKSPFVLFALMLATKTIKVTPKYVRPLCQSCKFENSRYWRLKNYAANVMDRMINMFSTTGGAKVLVRIDEYSFEELEMLRKSDSCYLVPLHPHLVQSEIKLLRRFGSKSGISI